VKKLVLGILVAIAVAMIGIAGVASTRPDTFHVERSLTVNAAPATIFPLLNDMRQFGQWSPWEKLDPTMKRTLTCPTPGVGCTYEWSGNDKAGAGSMKITESVADTRVKVDLHFLKPMESTAVTTWAIARADTGSKITWSMDGKNEFVGKVFSLFADMDKLVGGDFENGLANLKKVAEALPPPPPPAPPVDANEASVHNGDAPAAAPAADSHKPG
jgi:hypothetical protein